MKTVFILKMNYIFNFIPFLMALLVDAPPDVGFMIVISPILSSSISILVTVSAALRK